jgi:deoxyribonuclease IV
MPILGAHASIAGGIYKAVERAGADTCECVQFFSKNNNQWKAKPLAAEDVAAFRQALREHGIGHPLIHDSYLINLASPDAALWRKSIDAFVEELHRAESLGVPYVVTHPGSHTTATERQGLRRVVWALDSVQRQAADWKVRVLLETTAGQGTNLGASFDHLAVLLEKTKRGDELGICFDTCHVFAAGYPLETKREYEATMAELDRTVGLDRVKAFHLNDSRREVGSRVDRHAHIGRGEMGLEPFRFLMNDRRFRKVPMYLETPKGEEDGESFDVINLRTLRGLVEEG